MNKKDRAYLHKLVKARINQARAKSFGIGFVLGLCTATILTKFLNL